MGIAQFYFYDFYTARKSKIKIFNTIIRGIFLYLPIVQKLRWLIAMSSIGGRQDSPMVDEMLDGGQMDVNEVEDAISGSASSNQLLNDL